jgi:hypothetical protein
VEEPNLDTAFRELIDLLKKHERAFDEKRRAELEDRYNKEKSELERSARKLTRFLAVLILVLIAVSSGLVLWTTPLQSNSAKLALAVATGTLGSAVAALLSALDRQSHGWELSDGSKYPKNEPADKFQLLMLPFFWARPLLGSVMGLLLYLYPWTDKLTGASGISIGFWGFVLGYLAKSFLDVIKSIFKNVFGK